ncbi:MAG: hypothetical protein ACO1QB_10270 [Verrucomicrobiales bacterium]
MIGTVELKPKVRQEKTQTLKSETLRREALESFSVVMEKLQKLRAITGEAELVNLGRLIGEVTERREDPRLEEAYTRGTIARESLKIAEGGSISAEEAAKAVGMSKVAILKRYRAGRLLAWREERQNAFRFPAWQFQNGRVLEGLEDVLAKLNAGSRLDDFGRLLFFLSKTRFLNEQRPLDCLRKGEVKKVLHAAEGYGQ